MHGEGTARNRRSGRHDTPAALLREELLSPPPGGPMLGELAPDFLLEAVAGANWRLSDLDGQPRVLIFVDTERLAEVADGIETLRDQVDPQLSYLFICRGAKCSYATARERVRALAASARPAGPVLLERADRGTAQDYGGAAVFVLDRERRVAFRGEHLHIPTLRHALQRLQQRGWRGALPNGVDRSRHRLSSGRHDWSSLSAVRQGKAWLHGIPGHKLTELTAAGLAVGTAIATVAAIARRRRLQSRRSMPKEA